MIINIWQAQNQEILKEELIYLNASQSIESLFCPKNGAVRSSIISLQAKKFIQEESSENQRKSSSGWESGCEHGPVQDICWASYFYDKRFLINKSAWKRPLLCFLDGPFKLLQKDDFQWVSYFFEQTLLYEASYKISKALRVGWEKCYVLFHRRNFSIAALFIFPKVLWSSWNRFGLKNKNQGFLNIAVFHEVAWFLSNLMKEKAMKNLWMIFPENDCSLVSSSFKRLC